MCHIWKMKPWPAFKAGERKQLIVSNLTKQLLIWRVCWGKNVMTVISELKIVTFARVDMREICKALCLALLRSSIIVHKLEILPKLAGSSCRCFNAAHSEAKKSKTARERKTEPFMGCLIHWAHILPSIWMFWAVRCYKSTG